MSLGNNSRQDFYTFGIYGRDFNLDTATPAGSSQITPLFIVGLAAVFLHIINLCSIA